MGEFMVNAPMLLVPVVVLIEPPLTIMAGAPVAPCKSTVTPLPKVTVPVPKPAPLVKITLPAEMLVPPE